MLDACPKCETPRERAESRGACPTCGLRTDLWATFDDHPPPDPVLDPPFSQLVWSEPQSHDAFISLAQTAGLLDGAAARYRRAIKDGAADEEQARRALGQIAILAVHAGQISAPLSAGGLKILRVLSTIVAFVLFALVGVVLWRTFGKGFRGW
jgi:hypothetical protein